MFKFIKNWIATNRKSRDEKAEEKFREKLSREYLLNLCLYYLKDGDEFLSVSMLDTIEIKHNKKILFKIGNSLKIKEFIKEGGIILLINDSNLYKKVKYLEKKGIRYLITEDEDELKYNTKEIDYGF